MSGRCIAESLHPDDHNIQASQGTPAKRGQAPGAAAADGPRLCPRSYSGFFSQCAISPTTPRLNAITQITKIAPWTTVTQAPICAR